MSESIYFIEFKSSDRLTSVKELVEPELIKAKIPQAQRKYDNWAIYSNDRLVTSWSKKIRPRSKMLVVNKKADLPEINIAFDSKELIVLDKPSNLPTQKTLKSFEDNLYDQVRFYYLKQKSFPQGIPYVGLHHRLDRGTSGLVLMTKQRSANKDVADLFKNRKIIKEYVAYTEFGSKPPNKKWTQSDNIKRGTTKKHKFFFHVDEEGDTAVSQFEVLESKEGSWHKLMCRPKTGRTHQLRVHLRHKGYPILGDAVYGKKKSANRLMLHAQSLFFKFRDQNIEVHSEPNWPTPK